MNFKIENMKNKKPILLSITLFTLILFLTTRCDHSHSIDKAPVWQIPENVSGPDQKAYGDFAWKAFMALNWPAENGQPLPDTKNAIPKQNNYSTVWTKYKESYEIFDTETVTPWGQPTPVDVGACAGSDDILAPDFILADVFENPKNPLVGLDGSFARVSLLYNKSYFDYIISSKLDNGDGINAAVKDGEFPLKKNTVYTGPNRVGLDTGQIGGFNFPVGSIMLKAAWAELKPGDAKNSQFYTTKARLLFENESYKNFYESVVNVCGRSIDELVLYDEDKKAKYKSYSDPSKPIETTCEVAEMGLVGFHLVVKTSDNPDWIWATFEHKDNVPDSLNIDASKEYSFFNTKTLDAPQNQYLTATSGLKEDAFSLPKDHLQWFNPVQKHDIRSQISRVNPIDKVIADLNNVYQQKYKNTIWANYFLVGVQWVEREGEELPVIKPTPRLGNAAIESYIQSTSDCIGCHAIASSVTVGEMYYENALPIYAWNAPIYSKNDTLAFPGFSWGAYKAVGGNLTAQQVHVLDTTSCGSSPNRHLGNRIDH